MPAMVWQRLMAYAHQKVELKPIPGIEKPFLDTPPGAVVADSGGESGGEAEAARPALLSARTTRLLNDMAQAFRQAPALRLPPEAETLSAL